jgi:hypothetical protein
MRPRSFKRHRFPPEIIRHAIWLYARFTLSFRDVEELLAERGIAGTRWSLASVTTGHHGPSHSGDLVGKGDGGDFGRPPR